MKKSKPLIYLEYLVFLSISCLIRAVPRRVGLFVGDILGYAAFYTVSRKKVALKNLDIAYGDLLTRKEKEAIVRKCFGHFIKSAMDFILLSKMNDEQVKKLVSIKGEKHALQALEKKKGILLLGLHYGNWELIPATMSAINLPPVTIIARRQDNPYIEKEIMYLRNRNGKKNFVHKDKAARTILSALKKNQAVAILFDQNTSEGIFANFFGTPAATSRSIGVFAASTGSPIIPAVCVPKDDLTYEITYGPEITYSLSGDKQKDVQDITQSCNNFIEKTIRSNPEFWLWGHKRWKTRPQNQPGLY